MRVDVLSREWRKWTLLSSAERSVRLCRLLMIIKNHCTLWRILWSASITTTSFTRVVFRQYSSNSSSSIETSSILHSHLHSPLFSSQHRLCVMHAMILWFFPFVFATCFIHSSPPACKKSVQYVSVLITYRHSKQPSATIVSSVCCEMYCNNREEKVSVKITSEHGSTVG